MPLPQPHTQTGIDGLCAILAQPERALIVLDFDGTLAAIVPDPALARPYPGAAAAVRAVARRVGTVAILTGRPAMFVATLLELDADAEQTNLIVVGHYGLQTWTPASGLGGPVRTGGGQVGAGDDPTSAIGAIRAALPRLLAEWHAPAGTFVEDKGQAIAVHLRRTADPAAAMSLLREPLARLAADHGLRLEPGRLVFELRSGGSDKGRALDVLVAQRGAKSICFAGDDLGDLAAFDALDRWRRDGLAAVAVCSWSSEVPELAQRADLVVDGPAGVVAFLVDLADAVERAT